MTKLSVSDIQLLKGNRPITMLTAYDYPFARIMDRSGIDIILIGDSLANVVLGLESTRDVGMTEMLHHVRAVTRAVEHALVVGDMPYSSYQVDGSDPVIDARRLLNSGCQAVKVEWFKNCLEVIGCLRKAGIPVMGHIGLTPQTADETGGFKVRGKTSSDAMQLCHQAMAMEEAGCFSVLMECVPAAVAKVITEKLKVPTIGIGAGPACDGQVLVVHDMLGISSGKSPKFVRKFIDGAAAIENSVKQYIITVQSGTFPGEDESYGMQEKELEEFLEKINKESG